MAFPPFREACGAALGVRRCADRYPTAQTTLTALGVDGTADGRLRNSLVVASSRYVAKSGHDLAKHHL